MVSILFTIHSLEMLLPVFKDKVIIKQTVALVVRTFERAVFTDYNLKKFNALTKEKWINVQF